MLYDRITKVENSHSQILAHQSSFVNVHTVVFNSLTKIHFAYGKFTVRYGNYIDHMTLQKSTRLIKTLTSAYVHYERNMYMWGSMFLTVRKLTADVYIQILFRIYVYV